MNKYQWLFEIPGGHYESLKTLSQQKSPGIWTPEIIYVEYVGIIMVNDG